jgi:hypothetical protein
MQHYLSLGVDHFVFLDNGSTDGTVEMLERYEQVTVLRTGLPFVEYQFVMKRYLIETFGRDRWSLCVDIDELFDYPYSDIVELNNFLSYLSNGGYTAVASQMLDMFPEEPLREGSGNVFEDEPLKDRHRYYDLSAVTGNIYAPPPGSRAEGDNSVSNTCIEVLRGGIKKSVFDYSPILTKHPLIFYEGVVKPFDNSAHWASSAHVADLTCVLRHYTFLELLYTRLRRDLRDGNYFSGGKFRQLSRVLENSQELNIKRETSKEFVGVNQLVDEGFLEISADYMRLVDVKEEQDPSPETLHNRPYRLAEALSKARATEANTAQAVTEAKARAETLDEELRSLRRKRMSIERQNSKLESELKSVSDSESWRVLGKVAHIRDTLFGSIRRK